MDISKKLKSVRESKGLTVEELAEKSGKSTETVMGWEDGTVVPTASDLILLSKTYEMTMDEMIYNDQNAPEYNREKAVYANEIVQKPMRKGKVKKALSFTKGEKITLLIFPVLCGLVFLALGLFTGLWNPGWVVFTLIPVYYVMIFILRIIDVKVDNELDDV